MAELDYIEIERRDRNYEELNKIIASLANLSVFPSLMWLWSWDIVKYQLDYYTGDSGEEYVANPKLTEKQVFDLFWEDADKNGFTLEYGTEDLQEAVFDWMMDRDILISVEQEEQIGRRVTPHLKIWDYVRFEKSPRILYDYDMTETTLEYVLTNLDRCDRCSAQALYLCKGITGELMFCRHHFNSNKESLTNWAYEVIDESNKIS